MYLSIFFVKKKNVIIITGATASGKSAIALKIAKEKNGVIINADSMQIYKYIPIITAQPSQEDKKDIQHYLYGFVELDDKNYSVGRYLQDLKNTLDFLKTNEPDKTPIIVGGTMLYISSIINGISRIPEIDVNIRNELRKKYENCSVSRIFADLQKIDREYSLVVDVNNPVRIIRGIEVKLSTGQSILDFWRMKNQNIFDSEYCFEKYIVKISREQLYDKINTRFDKMIDDGLLDEIKKVNSMKLNYLPNAIGLKHMINFINGRITIDTAIDLSKKDSRNYAKRQITWFNNKFKDFIQIPSL